MSDPIGSESGELLGAPWQICFVVERLEPALQTWVEKYGVGPWKIWDLGPDTLEKLAVDEHPEPYGMRIAITNWGPMEIELIEPRDDGSIYAQSLRAHGGRPHIHHLHCTARDYDAVLDTIHDRGQRALMSGGYRGGRFAYLSTEDDIGTILEIGVQPDGWTFPEHESVYPG